MQPPTLAQLHAGNPSGEDVYAYVFPDGVVPAAGVHRPLTLDQDAECVRVILRTLHRRAAVEPIRFPDPAGCFPAAISFGALRMGLGTPIVTPDACVLGNDVGYACRAGRRTTLVTAANTSAVRLFCAWHVIDDICRHADEFANRYGVSREAYLGYGQDVRPERKVSAM